MFACQWHNFGLQLSLMRKMLAILLVSVHLLGNTEASQLLKLPQLLHHYLQHHRQDPSISFFEFLSMHYSGDDGTNADDDADSQLPCHNLNHNTTILTYSPMVSDLPSMQVPFAEPRSFRSNFKTDISSEHVLLIKQPPRFS